MLFAKKVMSYGTYMLYKTVQVLTS